MVTGDDESDSIRGHRTTNQYQKVSNKERKTESLTDRQTDLMKERKIRMIFWAKTMLKRIQSDHLDSIGEMLSESATGEQKRE